MSHCGKYMSKRTSVSSRKKLNIKRTRNGNKKN